MTTKLPRRDFLKSAPIAAYAITQIAKGAVSKAPTASSRIKIEPFDYRGVKLRESRWQKQYQAARDFYFGVSDDDILCGYRGAAGLASPGKPLGGWCARNSNTVFGQWLSGLSRFACALGDAPLREKVIRLYIEWAKTVKPDGNCGMNHYPFEKLVGGLVDMQLYLDYAKTTAMLERVTDWASKNLDRTRAPATPKPWEMHSGKTLEWYT